MGNNHAISSALSSQHYGQVPNDFPLWLMHSLEFCDWEDRAHLTQLNKLFHKNTRTQQYYRFLCHRLAEERGLYVPNELPHGETWQSVFLQLYPLRNLWFPTITETGDLQSAIPADVRKWKIQVFARFRPLNNGLGLDGIEEENCAKVTIPLHQRLTMIKLARKLKSNKDALKILAEEGSWFQEKWKSVNEAEKENDNSQQNQQNQRSFYTRALNETKFDHKKIVEGSKIVSKVLSCDAVNGRVVMLTPDVGIRDFSFDGVLPAQANQESTYNTCVRKLVVDMLNGFNATAIMYGQTGSGKTYSMFGPHVEKSVETNFKRLFQPTAVLNQGKGIVPRACEEILRAMEKRRELSGGIGIDSELKVSYVEIYGDHVSDLLRNGQRVGQSKVSSQRYVLSGAVEEAIESIEDLQNVLERGDAQKRRAATAMNDRSTRAHSLFILSLKQRKRTAAGDNANVTVTSRLFLADLGGSEQVKKSQVEAGEHRRGVEDQFSLGFELGERMREAVYINLGLLALKKCVEALHTESKHVPYNDSKLTMLLSEGLGGNCKTSIIVCGNLEPRHAQETIATMRFGERCAEIQTSAGNNASVLEVVLEDLDKRIAVLEAEILRKETWVLQEVKREDALAEEGTLEKALGGQEVVKVAVVTGAELERKSLEGLLLQRTALLGHDMKKEEDSKAHVIGFGKQYAEMYGLGQGFDEKEEELKDNARFAETTSMEHMPKILQQRKGKKSAWATGMETEERQEVVSKKVAKINRAKLAYSGISS